MTNPLETQLEKKYPTLCGIDENNTDGKFCLVVCACVLSLNDVKYLKDIVKDSKKTHSMAVRENIVKQLAGHIRNYNFVTFAPWDVKRLGADKCVRQATTDLAQYFKDEAHFFLLDGDQLKLPTGFRYLTTPKADSKAVSVAAASILGRYFLDLYYFYLGEFARDHFIDEKVANLSKNAKVHPTRKYDASAHQEIRDLAVKKLETILPRKKKVVKLKIA